MTIKNKVAAVATSAALLASTALPAFASVTGVSSNNTTGADSKNVSTVNVDQTTVLTQENKADIDNDINIQLNTGRNNANKNNGGGDIQTGDAQWSVGVANVANQNSADLDVCGGCDFGILAGSEKTGADSTNRAAVDVSKTNEIFQENAAKVDNDTDVKVNTGDNNANKNSYGGYILGGDIVGVTSVATDVNRNMAILGGNGAGAYLESNNSETGADSTNHAKISAVFDNVVSQQNNADVENDTELVLNTGRNNANANNGGGDILGGSVATGLSYFTYANGNALDFDGCCDVAFSSDNHKTGADSSNVSAATLVTGLQAFQENCADPVFKNSRGCNIDNEVNGAINTGDNNTNKNNADANISGEIVGDVVVDTMTNENSMGDVSWDMSDSLAYWMFSMML